MKYLTIVGIGIALTLPAWGATDLPLATEEWSFHLQSTLITQNHNAFPAAYSGTNSLQSYQEQRQSFTTTLFLGRRLWNSAALYVDPELTAGAGLSQTLGMGGYPNAEIYRVDSLEPKGNLSRVYVQQNIEFEGEKEIIAADKNQLADNLSQSRLTFIFGKFSLNDFFDNNSYSHDPRTQYLNWALMDNGAWDYAADTRGYTWGLFVEFNQPHWAFRVASVLEPVQANQLALETDLTKEHGDNAELEVRYGLSTHPGRLRFLYFQNHAHMGNYRLALNASPVNPDVTSNRDYRIKYGFGINLEQEIVKNVGIFSRWGYNDGTTETWAFTEIDSTFSFGLSVGGNFWKRDQDILGLAWVSNGLSQDHGDYLAAGGYGFIIGDSRLNYAREQIIESYYSFSVWKNCSLAVDYQYVLNPAYNQDRGPVSIWAARAHFEL